MPRRTDDAALTYLSAAPPDSMFRSSGTVVSPTARLSARNDSTGETESRVVLLRAGEDRVLPIVTIREADPWSGVSHRYAWTADGTALLIRGTGTLSGQSARPLCLVYRVQEGDLIEPRECPSRTPWGGNVGAAPNESLPPTGWLVSATGSLRSPVALL